MRGRNTQYQDDHAVFSKMVRIGFVTAVNKPKRLVQVQFRDLDLLSGWIPVITSAGLPEVNEQVLVLYEPIRDGRGFVLGGIQKWQ